jgi:hypothetical protein
LTTPFLGGFVACSDRTIKDFGEIGNLAESAKAAASHAVDFEISLNITSQC